MCAHGRTEEECRVSQLWFAQHVIWGVVHAMWEAGVRQRVVVSCVFVVSKGVTKQLILALQAGTALTHRGLGLA